MVRAPASMRSVYSPMLDFFPGSSDEVSKRSSFAMSSCKNATSTAVQALLGDVVTSAQTWTTTTTEQERVIVVWEASVAATSDERHGTGKTYGLSIRQRHERRARKQSASQTSIFHEREKRRWVTNPLVLLGSGDDSLAEEEAIIFVELQVLVVVLLRLFLEELYKAVGQNPANFSEKNITLRLKYFLQIASVLWKKYREKWCLLRLKSPIGFIIRIEQSLSDENRARNSKMTTCY